MSYLDDLRRQADALKNRQEGDAADQWRRIQLVEAAALQAQRYLQDLGQQLEVLQPASHASYRFDARTLLQRPRLHGFRFDARKHNAHERELVDHVTLTCLAGDGEVVEIHKDFVADIDILDERLEQAGVRPEVETVRHPDTGKLVEVRYRLPLQVRLGVTITPEHALGRLQLRLRNFDMLETITCHLPPHELTVHRLDELARWWTGQPHRFLDGADEVRRSAPR